MVVSEEALTEDRARVERLEPDVVAVAEKRQQLLAERRKTSKSASRQWLEDGGALHEL